MMSPGHILTQKNRRGEFRYVLLDSRPHVNRWGFPARILTWGGNCRVCDCPFETTGSRSPRRPLARTCPTHRRHNAKV
jgi:hypothetical protein